MHDESDGVVNLGSRKVKSAKNDVKRSKSHKKNSLYIKPWKNINLVRFAHVYSVGMMLVRSQMVTSYGEKSNGEK